MDCCGAFIEGGLVLSKYSLKFTEKRGESLSSLGDRVTTNGTGVHTAPTYPTVPSRKYMTAANRNKKMKVS